MSTPHRPVAPFPPLWLARPVVHTWHRVRTLASVCAFAVWRRFTRAPAAPPATDPPPLPPPASSALYQHAAHPHTPRNPIAVHQAEQAQGGFNTRVAVWLTNHVGSMYCAYIFAGIGVGSLIGVFTDNVFLAALFGSVSSYFLQLVLLPVLAVGSNVLGRKGEIQAEENYRNVLRILHDQTQTAQHLAAQDAELLKQTALLLQLAQAQQTPSATTLTVSVPPPAPARLVPVRSRKPKLGATASEQ